MSEPVMKLGKTQIIWNRSSTLLKALVILLLVFSMVALVALSWVRISIANQTEAMRAEAAAVEAENRKLTERIENMDSQQVIRDIAKEELGLVSPDTVLIQPE